MFHTPSIIKKISNVNFKGCMKEKLEMKPIKNSCHVNAIHDSIKKR